MHVGTRVVHLAYANDLLAFGCRDESIIPHIANYLQIFWDLVGLRANL